MEITLLLKSFVGLVSLLAILLFALLYFSHRSKQSKTSKVKNSRRDTNPYVTLESLLEIIKNKKSTTEELSSALNKILKYHGKIHPKLGERTHPDFKIYGEIILRICHHPNTDKNIILQFDRGLGEKNKEYKKEINDFLTKGLDTRRV